MLSFVTTSFFSRRDMMVIIFILIIAPLSCVIAQCDQNTNCTSCLQTQGCYWYMKKDVVECKVYLQNTPHGDDGSFYIEPNIKLDGMNYNITTGLTKPVKFSFRFKPDKYRKYPLDIYYLMDISNSMNNVIKDLGEAIDKITLDLNEKANLRFGFGSFIEKVTRPFVNNPERGDKLQCKNCSLPYSFKNHMSLDHNVTKFEEILKSIITSGNVDSPENSLDALVQAVVCKEIIGWRNNSRRVIVLLTDNNFHVAGDGKLGGIVLPNDLICHVENNSYIADTIYDYPSVGQIIDLIDNNNINLLFIIKDNTSNKRILQSHHKLSKKLSTGHTADSSSNLTKIVTEYYNNITATISFEAKSKDKDRLDIDFSILNCNMESSCNKSINEELNVTVTINPKTCLKTNISINPTSLETIIYVDLNVRCDCDNCPINEHSTLCNGHGDSKCGQCVCDKPYYGDKCECEDVKGNNTINPHCQMDPNDDVECNGNGKCYCNKCRCSDGYTGKYCDCNNNGCEYVDKKMCSGNGECKCGKCICNTNYIMPNCNCLNRTDTCMNSKNDKVVCSGHGECVCGKCKCLDAKYEGNFCEKCTTTCKLESCQKTYACILNDDVKCEDNVIPACDNMPEGLYDCGRQIQDPCTFNMYMDENNNKYYYCKKCQLSATGLSIIISFSVLAAVLIPLLIWKLFTHFKDKAEYEKFEKQMEYMQWHQEMSPLFVSPVTHVSNPMYQTK